MNQDLASAPIAERFDHFLKVIGSKKFLNCEGLGNEVPFFVIPFAPQETNQIEKLRGQLVNRLGQQGVKVLHIDLYDLVHEIMVEEGDWDCWMKDEASVSKQILKEELQGILDSETILIPAIAAKMSVASFDVMFLSGAGTVFPYIRSHNVLHNLQKVAKERPTVLFFPGQYEHSLEKGTWLDLFAPAVSLADEQDDKYYRAFNIYDRDA